MNEGKKERLIKRGFKAIKSNALTDLQDMITEYPEMIHAMYEVRMLTKKGHCLLSYAYERKNLEAVSYLVSAGADVNVPTSYKAMVSVYNINELSKDSYTKGAKSLVEDAMDNRHYNYVETLTNAPTFSIERSTKKGHEQRMINAALADVDVKLQRSCRKGFQDACNRHVHEKSAEARKLLQEADKWVKTGRYFDPSSEVKARQKLRR